MAVKMGVKVVGNEVRIIIRKNEKRGLRIMCQGGEGVFSGGSQEGLMARPQSRLDVCCSLWMCRTSSTRLFQKFPSTSLVLVASQFTWCWFVQEWTAIPFLVSCFFTPFLCSLSRFSSVLLVSCKMTLSRTELASLSPTSVPWLSYA